METAIYIFCVLLALLGFIGPWFEDDPAAGFVGIALIILAVLIGSCTEEVFREDTEPKTKMIIEYVQ